MTSRELRQSFLDFFAGHDHRILPGSSLKPGDETTLFTSAGMQQFVPWFRGIVPAAYPRVATCQKCFRADDIEQVGLTPWHCTFFEMLGNFSFGDYFKEGAIEYAWEYVTRVLQIPKPRIWITVHPQDEESPGIWKRVAVVADDRIVPDPTNFWALGKSGPCGPDTELHFDRGEEFGCGRPDCNPTCGCTRFTELWNLVFQTYNRTEENQLEPLPEPGIDTGMGFERVAAVLQGAPSIFETDLLAPIVSAALTVARQLNRELPQELGEREQRAAKIIADHTRGLAFLLAEGFTPSNEGAGYVVRRVLRRAYRFGRALGIEEPFLYRLVDSVVDTMGDVYPELRAAQQRMTTWVRQEERQFEETLERAWPYLIDAIEKAKAGDSPLLPGDVAFKLHDTYGLPKDIAAEEAAEHGLGFDGVGFLAALMAQQARSDSDRFAYVEPFGYDDALRQTEFVGYDQLNNTAKIIHIVRRAAPEEITDEDGKPLPLPSAFVATESAASLRAGQEGEVFLDQTPFYAESGGQVGDRGELRGNGAVAEVLDTYYPVEGAHAHKVKVLKGELRNGQVATATVDRQRRQATARAHTATHLLHHVLRQVLGEHAVQSGSLVEADRLRFDFAHFAALTPEERQRIEDGVVELTLEDQPLVTREMGLEEARAAGAVALFGEKYGERVRMVQIGEYSRELCGGTHLARTSAIGPFAIVSEGSIGTGLRRIEAVTGVEAQARAARQRELLAAAAEALETAPEQIGDRIRALQDELRRAQREIARLQQKSAGALAADLAKDAAEVNGVKLLVARVELPPEALRGLADDLLRRLGSGVVVLGCEHQAGSLGYARAHFVAEVSKDLIGSGLHAGNLIREVAKVAGGGGGGRPDFAQAGGKNPERLDEALAKARELVAAHSR